MIEILTLSFLVLFFCYLLLVWKLFIQLTCYAINTKVFFIKIDAVNFEIRLSFSIVVERVLLCLDGGILKSQCFHLLLFVKISKI